MNNLEQELLLGAQQFEMDALAAIYDRYQPQLYAYAMRLLGDPYLAEDCVAETFTRLLKALRVGQGPEKYLQAYLYQIAHNLITDTIWRKAPPPVKLDERLSSDEGSHPEAQTEIMLMQIEMRAALYKLTPDQRQVIILRFFEGFSIQKVAEVLNKPADAVKALQHRGIAALGRQLLKKDAKDEEHVPGTRDRSATYKMV